MTPIVDPSNLEQRVAEALCARTQHLATAESCTGGLIAHRLTNLPGSSAFFLGGIVSYSNALKESLLGVSLSTLESQGAVSEATAEAMVRGALARTRADWAVAVTGIAGPGGGSEAKPVGLVYIATGGPLDIRVTRNQFHGDRLAIKTQTADAALTQLWEHLKA